MSEVNNDLLVYVKSDEFHEYECFSIIRKDLLEDLRYIVANCYFRSRIVLEVEYNKIIKIDLENFKYNLENLCISSDDYMFNDVDKIKASLIKLAEYYDVDCYYDFELIYKGEDKNEKTDF